MACKPAASLCGIRTSGVRTRPSRNNVSGAGLDQINLTVPAGLGTGDVSLQATVGGVQTPSGVVISLLIWKLMESSTPWRI
jgi:hypothetical protein